MWETLLAALEILIRVHHPNQVFNIRQFLKAEVVHRFLLTCQVLQVGFCHKAADNSASFPTAKLKTHVCLKEHRDDHLTAIPQEVCLSIIKILQEVLGSPPDMELLKLICNFLLAVHPPTNTYVCHTPSSFYFSLHIGEDAVQLNAESSVSAHHRVNALSSFDVSLFVRREAVPGKGAVHYVPETLEQWRKVCLQLCRVTLPDCFHRCST